VKGFTIMADAALSDAFHQINDLRERMVAGETREINCRQQVVEPLRADLQKLSTAIMHPREGLIRKVDDLAQTTTTAMKSAQAAAEEAHAGVKLVADQLHEDRVADKDERIARDAVLAEVQKRAATKQKWFENVWLARGVWVAGIGMIVDGACHIISAYIGPQAVLAAQQLAAQAAPHVHP
jgi:rubrerythrin